jgi:hypothetical protein
VQIDAHVQDQLPDRETTWKAINIYLRHAYPAGSPPPSVKSQIESAHNWAGFFYDAPLFATTDNRVLARLGNKFYPHMKLAIEMRPDGKGCMFKADTHDRHVRVPPESKEYNAFRQLMETNQKIAEQIEQAWAAEGIPTFKTFLREDLERRRTGRLSDQSK